MFIKSIPLISRSDLLQELHFCASCVLRYLRTAGVESSPEKNSSLGQYDSYVPPSLFHWSFCIFFKNCTSAILEYCGIRVLRKLSQAPYKPTVCDNVFLVFHQICSTDLSIYLPQVGLRPNLYKPHTLKQTCKHSHPPFSHCPNRHSQPRSQTLTHDPKHKHLRS